MTERELKYIDDCQSLLEKIRNMDNDAGSKAVCVNALSKHIREVAGMWTDPVVSRSQDKMILIGLTFADLIQLQNGGTIAVPARQEDPPQWPITIFLGGTDEHMRKGVEKHPDANFRFFDSHGDKQN